MRGDPGADDGEGREAGGDQRDHADHDRAGTGPDGDRHGSDGGRGLHRRRRTGGATRGAGADARAAGALAAGIAGAACAVPARIEPLTTVKPTRLNGRSVVPRIPTSTDLTPLSGTVTRTV